MPSGSSLNGAMAEPRGAVRSKAEPAEPWNEKGEAVRCGRMATAYSFTRRRSKRGDGRWLCLVLLRRLLAKRRLTF